METKDGMVQPTAKDYSSKDFLSATGIEHFLPADLRELAPLAVKLALDKEFRMEFTKDPAIALSRAGMKVQPRTVEMLIKSDKAIFDSIAQQSENMISRSKAFTWEGERVMVAPLVAAFLAGALVAEALHHHSPAMKAAEYDLR